MSKLRLFKKTKPVWAKILLVDQEISTLEGPEKATAGDYLCRGIHGEVWPQGQEKFLSKYSPSGEFDNEAWQRFDPKPDMPLVSAEQVKHAFELESRWGAMKGKRGDYIVRSLSDDTDIWVVDKKIFEQSYVAVVKLD